MEAKNMGLMSETDNIIAEYYSGKKTYREVINELWPQACELTERMWKVFNTSGNNQNKEFTKLWLRQWCNDPEYNQYNADDVELLIKGNSLFLIPYADKKPIKVIIA